MTEDPKPWFYAGLFSLAAPDEATRFLQGHWFTAACIPSGAAMPAAASKDLADETQDKLHRIREALARLPQPK